MARSRCSGKSLKPRVLGIEILDATFYCLTEATRNHLGACFGGSDEELLFAGMPQILEGGDSLNLSKQNLLDKYFCCSTSVADAILESLARYVFISGSSTWLFLVFNPCRSGSS